MFAAFHREVGSSEQMSVAQSGRSQLLVGSIRFPARWWRCAPCTHGSDSLMVAVEPRCPVPMSEDPLGMGRPGPGCGSGGRRSVGAYRSGDSRGCSESGSSASSRLVLGEHDHTVEFGEQNPAVLRRIEVNAEVLGE